MTNLYLEPGDGIIEACVKLTKTTEPELTIVIPRRGLLLQNLINLKILKRYGEEQGKKIAIATQDPVGRKFATEAGFALTETTGATEPDTTPKVAFNNYAQYEPLGETLEETVDLDERLVEEVETEEDLENLDEDDEDYAPEPDSPTPGRKLRILGRPNFKLKLPQLTIPKITLPQIKLERHHRIILAIVLVGLITLGSVSYFVVPKAYATIEVPSDPFKKQLSLMLVDEDDTFNTGANTLPGRFIEVTRENVATFDATGSENTGAKAEGKITVLNYTRGIQGLLANTRFQASNGLVFRLKADTLIPGSNGSNPGRAIADAISDEGGAKYNVAAPLKMTVPGLGPAGESLVVGEVNGTFIGGTDSVVKVVSQQDIDRAKEEAAKNVFASAETELREQLKRGEELEGNFIQNDVIDALPSVSAGSKKDQFEVRVQSRSWTLVVPANSLREAINNAAQNEAPEGRAISAQTIEKATIEPTEGNFLTRRINLVVTLDGRVGPKIDDKQVVQNVANQPKRVAEDVLKAIPDVTSASLEMWPGFMPRTPLLLNHIKLRVIYLGE